jgi:hypothetical protein
MEIREAHRRHGCVQCQRSVTESLMLSHISEARKLASPHRLFAFPDWIDPAALSGFFAWKRGQSLMAKASRRLGSRGLVVRAPVTGRFPPRSSTAMLPSQGLEITQGW